MNDYCTCGNRFNPACPPTNTPNENPTTEPITLTIGTVTTGDPGSEAAASITGTSPNFVLNLTIPQGPVGPVGPEGPAGGTTETPTEETTTTE